MLLSAGSGSFWKLEGALFGLLWPASVRGPSPLPSATQAPGPGHARPRVAARLSRPSLNVALPTPLGASCRHGLPLPVHTVHVDDREHLAEGDDEQRDGAGIAVQQGEPVLAGVQREDERQQVRPQADEA